MMKVVTRIPPSPTGRLHIGTARTALFNYLYARGKGGRVVFRSEDTDRARSMREFEDEIIEGLRWLGLSWDEFLRQSERTNRYQEVLEKAVTSGKAYVSKEPKKDNPTEEVDVVRLKNPGTEVVFDDLVHGPINTHTGELGDFVIARSMTDPLYHFAVVVDDMDSGVTHVIRGEDHISNTARQILIQEAVGAPRPIYAHLPLILDKKRTKLSKRSGATSLMDYRAEGCMPEAMVNYLALLGWNPGDEREDFSLAELVEDFSLERVQKSGASWDRDKLLSVNQRWMRKLTPDEYLARGAFDESVRKAVPLLKERAHTFGEARELLKGELACLFATPSLNRALLTSKGGNTARYLNDLMELIPDSTEPERVRAALMSYADKEGRGATLWPLRYALSGQERSPDPFTLIALLGKQTATERIRAAIAILS
ncbi:hypothetical protein A3H77_02590 [Candidatus Kaiserbacteria bacterium RIFCSPLOWO2_02_FULL_56_11]|nr:MAG: hypothetical protein A3H77_02590 [Candidatus Kaiserbacteria bacterium RIFCSPLOWO2_02_FULL_56_11]